MYALFNDISEDATYPNQRFSRYNSYDLQGLSRQSSCSHAAHPDFNHFPGVHGGALNALGQEDPCQWFFSQGPSDEKYPLGAPTFDTGDTRPQFVYPPDLSGLVSPNDWIVPSTLNSQYNRFVPSTLNSRYNRHLHSEEGSRMRLDNIIASVSAPPPGVSGQSPSYGKPVPSGLNLPCYQHFHTSEDRSRVWSRNTEAPISALLPGINEHSYQSNTLDSWISHFPNTSAPSRWDATPGYGSFPQSTRMHSDESHSSQWDPALPSGRGAPSNMFPMGIPQQPQCITSMPSYSSLGGWNGGFFNSTTTMSATTRPYDSSSICVNPWSNTAAAPDFTQTGDSVSLMSFPTHSQEVSREQEPNWPSAVAWVDGAHTRAPANPNSYNVGSEPRTERVVRDAACPNCLAGDAQCQNCKRCARRRRRLISGAYLTIAKELGYVPPARLDRIFILDEEAQEQELEERSALDEEDDNGIV
ncbi:hypothetical protein BU17DRAFT_85954 [Hysterangium stoloniferum]|nr:hypothetical protein BU17DRAFT_85954 [Hysterangium stoloniferum]